MHLVPHLERFGDGREGRSDLAWRDLEVFEGELRAHQELTELAVGVMVGIQDVATGIMDEPGDARHDALAVLAMNQQHDRLGVVRHPGHRRAGLTDLGMVLSSGCQWERKTRVRLLSPRKGVNRKDLKKLYFQPSRRARPAPLGSARTIGWISDCRVWYGYAWRTGTHGTPQADRPWAVSLDCDPSGDSHTRELVLPRPRARTHRPAVAFSRRARVAGAAWAARAHPPHPPGALAAPRQARCRLLLHRLVPPLRALRRESGAQGSPFRCARPPARRLAS